MAEYTGLVPGVNSLDGAPINIETRQFTTQTDALQDTIVRITMNSRNFEVRGGRVFHAVERDNEMVPVPIPVPNSTHSLIGFVSRSRIGVRGEGFAQMPLTERSSFHIELTPANKEAMMRAMLSGSIRRAVTELTMVVRSEKGPRPTPPVEGIEAPTRIVLDGRAAHSLSALQFVAPGELFPDFRLVTTTGPAGTPVLNQSAAPGGRSIAVYSTGDMSAEPFRQRVVACVPLPADNTAQIIVRMPASRDRYAPVNTPSHMGNAIVYPAQVRRAAFRAVSGMKMRDFIRAQGNLPEATAIFERSVRKIATANNSSNELVIEEQKTLDISTQLRQIIINVGNKMTVGNYLDAMEDDATLEFPLRLTLAIPFATESFGGVAFLGDAMIDIEYAVPRSYPVMPVDYQGNGHFVVNAAYSAHVPTEGVHPLRDVMPAAIAATGIDGANDASAPAATVKKIMETAHLLSALSPEINTATDSIDAQDLLIGELNPTKVDELVVRRAEFDALRKSAFSATPTLGDEAVLARARAIPIEVKATVSFQALLLVNAIPLGASTLVEAGAYKTPQIAATVLGTSAGTAMLVQMPATRQTSQSLTDWSPLPFAMSPTVQSYCARTENGLQRVIGATLVEALMRTAGSN